jgi:integrase/recombinase XerD
MKTALESEEIELMEKAATNRRDHLLVRVLYRLGCRISEALAIRVADIDFEQETVTILHLKTRLRLFCPGCVTRLGMAHKFCPGCGVKVDKVVEKALERRKVRKLPLDEETLEMLGDFIRSDRTEGLIFKIGRTQAWKVVHDCAERAGLGKLVNPETGRERGISPHRFRDSFAVTAIKRDGSTDGVRMLQEHLGHANIGTTMRYRKIAGQELKEWYRKLWDKGGSSGG